MKFLRVIPAIRGTKNLVNFTELKQIARKCGFQDEDRMIRDSLVIGIADDQTRKKLLEKKSCHWEKP